MEEATKYKQYLKGLERIEAKDQLDKATKKVKAMEAAKAPVKNVFEKAIGVFPKVSKVGEDFVKRRMELAGKGALDYATKAAKASKYGKIAGTVAAAGIAASAYLRSKMKDIKEKQQSEEPEGKMGGGMMNKYSKGKSVKGYGQARKSGMGLEDENISLGKGADYIKDLL